MGRLDGKVAVVTGGASGMGAATVRRFVAEGARVVIADLQEDKATAMVAELGADKVAFQRVDVTQEADVATVIDVATRRWGSLDVMFNNAGFGGVLGPIDSVSEAEFDITFDVLLKGVFFGIKHACGPMKAQGSGSIINTASVAGLLCGETSHLYSVAKAAVIHLTKSTALELGNWGVRVNAICPGVIATPLAAGSSRATEETLDQMRARLGPGQPIGRIGEGEDIANMALFLASDESTFVTGAAEVVDGGYSAGRAWRRQSSMWTEARETKLYRPPGR